jgi:hypothetical protein
MADLLRPPPGLSELFACLDPAEEGKSVAIARDFMRPDFPKTSLTEAAGFLDGLLADDAISNADLKGFLNREISPAWSMELGFDADAKGARRCLEAIREAIAQRRPRG